MKNFKELKFITLFLITVFLMAFLFLLVNSFTEMSTKIRDFPPKNLIQEPVIFQDTAIYLPKTDSLLLDTAKRKLKNKTSVLDSSKILEKKQAITFNFPAKKDSVKRSILLTGDSMGDGLFTALRKVRKENNIEIKYEPWYGSTSGKWAAVKRLQESIEKNKPDLVIFTLGANELFIPLSKKRVAYVQELLRQFGNIEFVWVGSPNWKKDWGTDSMFHANIGSERYFVSKDIKFARTKDGAHPTFKASELWMDSIMVWINNNPKFNFKFYALVGQEKALSRLD